MTVKHTAGPWSFMEYPGERFSEIWSDSAERAICKVWHGGSTDELGEIDKASAAEENANAHLIAAAPDLLEALRGLMEWAGKDKARLRRRRKLTAMGYMEWTARTLNQAARAVIKAEGME